MEKQRDLSFDFIKGVLIFLVVFGHCLNELHAEHTLGWIDQWINSFHMPLFMFVSGWFAWHTMNKGFGYVVKNKSYRLGLPALCWTSVIFIQKMAMGEAVSLRLFYDSSRGIWFLWCLYALFFISAVIWRSNHKLMWAMVIASSLLLLWPWYPNDLLKHFKIPLHFPIFFWGAYMGNKYRGKIAPPYMSNVLSKA